MDSLNYIKGFRYELYCLARAAATPHVVVYCETPKETILQWNATRETGKWPESMYVRLRNHLYLDIVRFSAKEGL